MFGSVYMADWDPELYNRFRRYRAEPFEAILLRLELGPAERIIDLGCGSGENTVELARRTAEGRVLGVDSSPAMIDRALRLREGLPPGLQERLHFERGDLRELDAIEQYSLVFSNAAFQWVGEHHDIFARCYAALVQGGRLVVQMPANDHETAQATISSMAAEEPWRAVLGGIRPPSSGVAPPGDYATMLRAIGFIEVDCYYQMFHHPMGSPAEIVEWSRATMLRRYLEPLDADAREVFVDTLVRRLEYEYGTRGPLVFDFRRLFIWARRPSQ
jgi:trans-aconitate 2-methyltransferase